MPITGYFTETSRDQNRIKQLVKDNALLKQELKLRHLDESLCQPLFLQTLIEQNVKRASSKKLEYSDHLKKVSLYIFILTGPLAYEVLRSNLMLPSISTVRQQLGKETPVKEGQLQIEPIKAAMELRKEPMFVWISEDDTKITSRIKYNITDDCVMGLELPLSINGVPEQSFFKFTSIDVVTRYLEKYPKSSYAKLVMCQSLSAKSEAYALIIYGTSGSDKTDAVNARWKYISESLSRSGITALGKKN